MFKLVRFELKKIYKTRTFLFMVLSFFALILMYYTINYFQANQLYNEQILTNQNTIHNLEERIDDIKLLLELPDIVPAEKRSLNDALQLLESTIEQSKQRLEGLRNKDWDLVISSYIEEQKNIVQEQSSFGFESKDSSLLNRSLFTLESNLEKNKWLKEKGITPIFPLDYSITVYDQFDTNEEQQALSMAESFSADALFFQYKLTDLVFTSLGVLFFVLLFGDIVTKERLNNSGPINLLRTQPIKKNHILISKFIAIIIMSVLIIITVSLISVVIGTLFSRFGDGNYPILKYGQNETFSFLSLDLFLIQSFILFLFVILFVFSIHLFISTAVKQTVISVGVTMMIIFLGAALSSENYLSAITPYMPFSYLSVNEVITNERAVLIGNFSINFLTGIIVLSITTGLIWMIHYLVSKSYVVKKEIT